MKFNSVQEKMIQKITSYENTLSDFLEDSSIKIIKEELTKEDREKYLYISVKDIVIVSNYLINNDLLREDEIKYLAPFLSSNTTDILLNDPNFFHEISDLTSSIKFQIGKLDSKIKIINSRDELEAQEKRILAKKEDLLEKKLELSVSKQYMKISLSKIQKIKRNLNSLHRKGKLSGLKIELLNTDKIKIQEKLLSYAEMIDNNELSVEEMLEVANDLVEFEINDTSLRNEVKYVIAKLREKINLVNRNLKKTKKQIKGLIERENELEEYKQIDPSMGETYVYLKNSLKVSYKLLKQLTEKELVLDRNFRYSVKREVNAKKYVNLKEFEVLADKYQKCDFNIEEVNVSPLTSCIQEKSDIQSIILRTESVTGLSKYRGNNTRKQIKAFILNDKICGRSINKNDFSNFAFSIENLDNSYIVRLHVQNIQPYLDNIIINLLINNLYESLPRKISKITDEYEMYKKPYMFKLGDIKPTITYSFTFDELNNLTNFDVEDVDVEICDAKDSDINSIETIYRSIRTDKSQFAIESTFEELLKQEFPKYAKTKGLNILYYGKYAGEKLKFKKSPEKMGEDLEKYAEALKDLDRVTFNNISYKWYKNYCKAHFSFEYKEDFRYSMSDLSLLNPFSFIGYSTQKQINQLVFNKKPITKSLINNLLTEQQAYMAVFNGRCEYFDEIEYINMICDIAKEKTKQR